MRRWLLPESIEDVLPEQARRIERLRRGILDSLACAGYQYVIPPLLEYLESLLTGAGRDLELRTFKLVDQLSGRTMGVRADITPQVARIDAHLLNRDGVARLCYCASVLHTLPGSLTATREPLQIGAELYGHAGIEADAEILRLAARSLAIAGIGASRIDLGHVAIFRALARLGGVDAETGQVLFEALQAKDLPELGAAAAALPEPARSGLLALAELYGGTEVLERAARLLPRDEEIARALEDLRRLAADLADLPLSFDLADLRGYHYHNGVVFAAYGDGHPGAIAQGGRYDGVGRQFGRARPATGFSMDLREIARIGPQSAPAEAVLAPCGAGPGLREAIEALRAAGEVVVVELPGHEGTWGETGCTRRLVLEDGRWRTLPIRQGD
ncbi:MAG: ATP phosphoribosyltransferase regulatory subunit [Rhodocyclaceae bacterium]